MTKKIANTKRRIKQYIDCKGIKNSDFLKETGIKRGFLDTDKFEASVSDIFLEKIIQAYPDLNLYWLVTGKGHMLLKPEESNMYSDMLSEKKLPQKNAESIEELNIYIQLITKSLNKLNIELKKKGVITKDFMKIIP